MQSEEVFLGFHLTNRTNADSLLHLVESSLLSFGLSFTGVSSQGYDGASNMSGKNNDLQAKVIVENPKAFICSSALCLLTLRGLRTLRVRT